MQKIENLVEFRPSYYIVMGLARAEVRMVGQFYDLQSDLFGREHKIDRSGRDRASGHSIELRGLVLCKGDSAGRLDRFQSERSVRCGPGKNYSHRAAALILGQRRKEMIDRQIRSVFLCALA